VKAIALVTQKGGSGKSTLAIGLAIAAMEEGHKVYILETDRQGTVSNWVERRENPEPGFDRVETADGLDQALALLKADGRNLVLIDTPGTDSPTVTAAIRAADLCLIPTRPSPADIEATRPTLAAIQRLGRPFGFVLNQTPTRSFRNTEAAEGLKMFGVLAQPPLVMRNDHQDALGAGLGVTEYAPDGKAAAEIRGLWNWIKRKIKE
jgi:chromosome partitioning protein